MRVARLTRLRACKYYSTKLYVKASRRYHVPPRPRSRAGHFRDRTRVIGPYPHPLSARWGQAGLRNHDDVLR
jgi:hypothetical protein